MFNTDTAVQKGKDTGEYVMAVTHAYYHFADKPVPKAAAVCCGLQPKGREGQSKYTCQRSAIVPQRKEAGRQNGSGQELISRYCCAYSRRIRQIDRSVERNFDFFLFLLLQPLAFHAMSCYTPPQSVFQIQWHFSCFISCIPPKKAHFPPFYLRPKGVTFSP